MIHFMSTSLRPKTRQDNTEYVNTSNQILSEHGVHTFVNLQVFSTGRIKGGSVPCCALQHLSLTDALENVQAMCTQYNTYSVKKGNMSHCLH